MRHIQSICWKCKKATGGCSWSRELIPPKGAKTTMDTLLVYEGKGKKRYIPNAVILDCPEFVPDDPRVLPHVKGERRC